MMNNSNEIFDIEAIESVRSKLLKKRQTVAVAESVTSGLLQAAFSQAKDASGFFHGGITAYNLGQKARHLDIETIHADDCDCVSKKVAEEMAIGAASLFKSDYGLGITGYAATMPEQGVTKLFAYAACCYKGRVILSRKITANKTEEALETQLFYTNSFLNIFKNIIK